VNVILIGSGNVAPTANAGFDTTVGSDVNVVLTGSGSDSDGTITSYNWLQIGGPTSLTLSGEFTASMSFTSPSVSVDNTYTFQLTVTDDGGATAADTVIVTVTPSSNEAPIANAGVNQTVVAGNLVALTGSGLDSDGTVDVYSWSQISGPAITLTGTSAATLNFTAPAVSADTQFVFRLTVIDNLASIATADVTVIVSNTANTAPSADAGVDQMITSLSATVTLSDAGSIDGDGSIISTNWTQIGGPIVTLTGSDTSTATFTAPVLTSSILTFRLSVTDNGGAVGTDDVVVTYVLPEFPPSGVVPAGWVQSTSSPTGIAVTDTYEEIKKTIKEDAESS